MEEFQPRYHPIRIEGFEIKDRIDNLQKNIQEAQVDQERIHQEVQVDQERLDNIQKNLQEVKVDIAKLMDIYKD